MPGAGMSSAASPTTTSAPMTFVEIRVAVNRRWTRRRNTVTSWSRGPSSPEPNGPVRVGVSLGECTGSRRSKQLSERMYTETPTPREPVHADEWLQSGRVTSAAPSRSADPRSMAAGPGAFTTMVHRLLGVPPGEFRGHRADGCALDLVCVTVGNSELR